MDHRYRDLAVASGIAQALTISDVDASKYVGQQVRVRGALPTSTFRKQATPS